MIDIAKKLMKQSWEDRLKQGVRQGREEDRHSVLKREFYEGGTLESKIQKIKAKKL